MMFILKRRTKLQAQHFVIANFDAYQDGALTEADTAFYRQHLASCQECRDWESRQVRLIEQLGIELSPPSRLSPTAVDRMYQNLYRRMKWRNLMNITRSFLGTVAAVAIIAIAVGVFIWWQSDSRDETVQTTALEEETPVAEPVEEISLDEALLEAASDGDVAEVERLLKEGADPNVKDSFGTVLLKSEINRARSSNNIDNIRLLVEYGADVNELDSQGNALLPLAARNELPEVVELMLEAGADVKATMTFGAGTGGRENATALILAAENGDLELVKLLIAHGAGVNTFETFLNRTALHGAAWFNYPEMVQLLIEEGADLNPQDIPDGGTPLHYAAENGSTEAVQALIDAGANLNAQRENGMTPMMTNLLGDMAYKPEVVSLLLAGGANLDVQDGGGNTALHFATNYLRAEAVSILIEHGAALNLVNDDGATALDVATTEELAELLRAAGAGEE